MASRETLPVESEPYTKGYYMIWGALSFVAVIYIGYLAFGSNSAPIIKISKVSGKPSVAKAIDDQSRRIGSAMAIATRAADTSSANRAAIKSLEKRVQLLTWKLIDDKPLTGVSNPSVSSTGGNNSGSVKRTVKSIGNTAHGYVKQVMAGSGGDGGIVGHVISAATDAAKAEVTKVVTTKIVKTVSIDAISSIAGVVSSAPSGGSSLVSRAAQNLGALNPLKVAALAAGAAGIASTVGAVSKTTNINSATTDASSLVQKIAVQVPAPTKLVEPVVVKSPFKTMPLPARKAYGVRLTSGQSIEALRLTWDLINEMNRPILKGLTTRFISGPRSMGMPYRLIAGPMVSTVQAQTLCAKLHKQNINCDVTVFRGRKL